MNFLDILQAAKDFRKLHNYALSKYFIRDGKKHPFAILCPGGGYNMVCSFIEGRPFVSALRKRGYHAFVVYYRTKKKARYPHPQEDLKRAIETILANADKWNLEKEGWSLWGSSAGGHLAASFCMEDWHTDKPAALILIYPVITMGEHTHGDSHDNHVGKDADPELVDRLSVEKHITEDFPPTFIWNGTADTVVEPINSRMMEDALAAAGVPYKAEGTVSVLQRERSRNAGSITRSRSGKSSAENRDHEESSSVH